MQKRLFLLIFCLLVGPAQAQFSEKRTFSKAFYEQRRQALRQLLPAGSVAVFFANPIRNRSYDTNFPYHQNRNLFYLTGFAAPHSVLLIFKDPQRDSVGNTFDELLFTRNSHLRHERFDGARPTPQEVVLRHGIAQARYSGAFEALAINQERFSKVLLTPLPDDVRNTYDSADLHDLLGFFKEKVSYPKDYSPSLHRLYNSLPTKPDTLSKLLKSSEFLAQIAEIAANHAPYCKVKDQSACAWGPLSEARSPSALQAAIKALSPTYDFIDATTLREHMASLREIKTSEEIALLRRIIKISCIAQNTAMRAIEPGLSEREIQGIQEFVYRHYGCPYQGFSSIVGADENGYTLHYIENSLGHPDPNSLVLMDLGPEYHGYTGDITRTVPISGRFTLEQRLIYELVLRAQEASLAICKPGTTFDEINSTAHRSVAEGLLKLGIIEKKEAYTRYLPHHLTHHIGLDVHDLGHYKEVVKDMILTVEPGVYIKKGSPCDKKWWNVHIRIEDDILITETGYELLSRFSPRRPEAIEKLMAEDKNLSYSLPVLDSAPLPQGK